MPKIYTKVVDRCFNCPHWRIYAECEFHEGKKPRRLPLYAIRTESPRIPNWCPLPDAQKKGAKS